MKRSWLFTILLLIIMTGSALAEPVLVDDTTPKSDDTAPVEQVQTPPDVPAVAPVIPASPVEVPPENKSAPVPDIKPDNIKQDGASRGRDRDGDRPEKDRPSRPDDKDDGKKPHMPSHGKPHRSPPRVVYIYPNSPRIIERTEIYTYPVPSDSSALYPNGYVPPYQVGDYLPNNRQWFKLSDYAAYGLAKPRIGEEWVFNDSEVILISTSTGQILSAITLAAPIK